MAVADRRAAVESTTADARRERDVVRGARLEDAHFDGGACLGAAALADRGVCP